MALSVPSRFFTKRLRQKESPKQWCRDYLQRLIADFSVSYAVMVRQSDRHAHVWLAHSSEGSDLLKGENTKDVSAFVPTHLLNSVKSSRHWCSETAEERYTVIWQQANVGLWLRLCIPVISYQRMLGYLYLVGVAFCARSR